MSSQPTSPRDELLRWDCELNDEFPKRGEPGGEAAGKNS
jgi:hypothetical protein